MKSSAAVFGSGVAFCLVFLIDEGDTGHCEWDGPGLCTCIRGCLFAYAVREACGG